MGYYEPKAGVAMVAGIAAVVGIALVSVWPWMLGTSIATATVPPRAARPTNWPAGFPKSCGSCS